MTYLEGLTSVDPVQYVWDRYYRWTIEGAKILGRAMTDNEESQLRRKVCWKDPLLFALIYFARHLTDKEDDGDEDDEFIPLEHVTLSKAHLDFCRLATQWMDRKALPKEHRDAVVAPRHIGKSTWSFLILPMWALAHFHRRYVAAFADSGMQAQQHLISFKRELDTNALLRKDFPKLCAPARRASGTTVADRQDLYYSDWGHVFQAKGMDSSTLGSKIENKRPDLLLFDDVEPDESNYSEYQKTKRLQTILNAVFPMNLRAAVLFSGTVLMSGAIIHDMVRTITEPNAEDHSTGVDEGQGLLERSWVTEERIRVHYYPALMHADDETAAFPGRAPKEQPHNPAGYTSIWPERWPVEELLNDCHIGSFLISMQNSPRGATGGWWTDEDFIYEPVPEDATRWAIQLDPAVTTKETSDYTGVTVLASRPARRLGDKLIPAKVWVVFARKVKMVGEGLRKLVLNLIERFPRIKLVRVEANQGGETWQTLLRGLPVHLEIHHSEDPKEVRLARGLDYYQRGRVVHAQRLGSLEEDMIGYPKAANDDLPDSACLGINYFLDPPKRVKAGARTESYV